MTRIFDEKFEGVGYEEASWSETVGGSSTVDEDKATSGVTGAPANWDVQCLEIDKAGGDNAYTEQINFVQTDSWFRLDFILTAESLANGGLARFIQVWDNSWAAAFQLFFYQVSGSLKLRMRSFHNGSSNYYAALTTISLDTFYRVEVKWDITNNVWAWKIDGVAQPNDQDVSDPITSEGILSSTHVTDIDNIRLGGQSGDNAWQGYFDNFAIDDADWVGGDILVPIIWHHLNKNIGR